MVRGSGKSLAERTGRAGLLLRERLAGRQPRAACATLPFTLPPAELQDSSDLAGEGALVLIGNGWGFAKRLAAWREGESACLLSSALLAVCLVASITCTPPIKPLQGAVEHLSACSTTPSAYPLLAPERWTRPLPEVTARERQSNNVLELLLAPSLYSSMLISGWCLSAAVKTTALEHITAVAPLPP